MSIGAIVLVVLVLVWLAVLPFWKHSRRWGYGPTGTVGLVLAILIAMLLLGWI